MDSYQRRQVETLLSRLREEPRWLQIVVGPRQAGKTTIVQQVLARTHRPAIHIAVDAADPRTVPTDFPRSPAWAMTDAVHASESPRDTEWLVGQWERARARARDSEHGFVLALDEVQKIPNWSETVKGLWDSDRLAGVPLHVVLLGSAPLLMQRGLTESLTGRFETIRVAHWSFEEMAAAFDFDLDRYLYFGGYPGPAAIVRDEARWRAFIRQAMIQPTVERDILAMQRVDKPVLLKLLFGLGAEYSGQVLSYNKMLGQLQDAGNTTTLARYLDLLSAAGLLTGLSKYAGRSHRRRASSPKLQVLNTALLSAHSNYTFEQARADRTFWGRLVESAVGAHLINTGHLDEHRVHYWREGGREVDFVFEHGRRLVVFEVKSGRRRGSLQGLDTFRKNFPVRATHVVGQGGIPLAEFLLTPARVWFGGS